MWSVTGPIEDGVAAVLAEPEAVVIVIPE